MQVLHIEREEEKKDFPLLMPEVPSCVFYEMKKKCCKKYKKKSGDYCKKCPRIPN